MLFPKKNSDTNMRRRHWERLGVIALGRTVTNQSLVVGTKVLQMPYGIDLRVVQYGGTLSTHIVLTLFG